MLPHILRRTTQTIHALRPPPRLLRKHGIIETRIFAIASTVLEPMMPAQRNMVEPKVPNRRIHHPIRYERENRADERARDDVGRLVVPVDGEGAAHDESAEEREHGDEEFPELRLVVGEELELGVEVERHEDCGGEGGGCVAAGEGLHGFPEVFGFFAGAYLCRVVPGKQ